MRGKGWQCIPRRTPCIFGDSFSAAVKFHLASLTLIQSTLTKAGQQSLFVALTQMESRQGTVVWAP
jgi:hypothetical protein